MNKFTCRLLVFALLAFASGAWGQSDSASNLLSFANSLFAEKDYYRAITEYKRHLHLYPDSPMASETRLAVGLAYFRGEKWEAARAAFQETRDSASTPESARQAQLLMGESAYRGSDYPSALDCFDAFTRQHPSDPGSVDARMRVSQCLLQLDKNLPAKSQATSLIASRPSDERAADFAREMQSVDALPRKSPLLAGSLSAILPGAGQLYTGRPRDAGISFLLNGSLIALAAIAFNNDEPVAGGILTVLELSWYSGNIYGAVNGAHKYNRFQRQRFVNSLDIQCGIMRDIDDAATPFGGFRMSF
ncbi:MAG: tetratricopeptide repeat protein [Kiritimatiellia bacterium]